ncbi:MAG: NAD-dependent epimerase/dehydratase family protein [Rhodospirillales bacterium]|nr:NAD-dependent epimerase/dehydratase family protein [Rhodospirillales bacterium]
MTALVTGAAGFVGFHVVQALLARGEQVLGVDRLDSPFPALAAARLARLEALEGFSFHRLDLAAPGALACAAAGIDIERAVHLAGRAGLRGADGPTLVRDNILAQRQVVAFCRERKVGHLVHASSSAVYGGPCAVPMPISAYGATKRRAEILARASAAAGGPPVTSLRYFTLYGPWSRPDTAVWHFTDAILARRPVRLHGHGRMRRSFTFIGDAVAATLAALDCPPAVDSDGVRHAVADVRHPAAVGLEDFVTVLERLLARRALRERVPAARGEIAADAPEGTGPSGARSVPCHAAPTGIREGLARFVAWYLGAGRALTAESPCRGRRRRPVRPAGARGPSPVRRR